MSTKKYFVTVSWPDEAQPLLRRMYNLDVYIDDVARMAAYEIVDLVQQSDSYIRFKRDLVVNFLVALD